MAGQCSSRAELGPTIWCRDIWWQLATNGADKGSCYGQKKLAALASIVGHRFTSLAFDDGVRELSRDVGTLIANALSTFDLRVTSDFPANPKFKGR